VLSGSGFGEECVERIISKSNGLVRRHLAVGLDSVLQAEKLPNCVTGLNTSLSNVNTDALSHFDDGVV
jgi:hypothetical protein